MKAIYFILFLPLGIFSQTSWEKAEASEFLELIRSYEKMIPVEESYSLETGYTIYNDYRDSEPAISFLGKLTCKNGKELHVRQMGHVMVQDAAHNVTIDTAARQLLVQKPDASFFYRKTIADYSAFLEITETVSKRSENGKLIYLLTLKRGNPYHSMELTFNDGNHISQVTIFSNQPYYQEDQHSSARAKIVLDLGKVKKGKSVISPQFLTVSDCILVKDHQISAIGAYKDFEVIDLRN
ncbi:hypothetical protein [Pedobacter xixiisoli]|uniref:Outer membrane lipoprotein-sorting protein n=1 Tax=Pedobacter xixiisoli TaxID=1476464 RepID=A0A286A732_9SPHI|nr:hypothetical protein [Pedobacter xixiisoli]SOD17743.1 hypothetical protein SAMN06297358_2665 [Pedobacter xixiisoli]